MKRKLSILLSLMLVITLLSTTGVYAAKNVKSKSVSLSPKSMVLAVGDIAQLNATMKPSNSTDKLTWTSSDKSIVTVTSKGVVQGVANGKATITVKTTSKKTATCDIEVKEYSTDKVEPDSIFNAIKDKILALIKDTTYTKSEVDSKIAAIPSGGSSSEPQTKEDIIVTPSNAIDFKNANVDDGSCSADVHFNKIVVTDLTKNTYSEWINKAERDRVGDSWYKYDVKLSISGSVDSKYANGNVRVCFSSNYGNEFLVSNERDIQVKEDGTFSEEIIYKANSIPKELILDNCVVFSESYLLES